MNNDKQYGLKLSDFHPIKGLDRYLDRTLIRGNKECIKELSIIVSYHYLIAIGSLPTLAFLALYGLEKIID